MDRKDVNMQEKLLCIMLTAAGQDIPAPDEILNKELESFKIVKTLDDNDALLDCLVALNGVESQQERLEIIKILIIKMLTFTKTFKVMSYLKDYGTHLLDWLRDHPEACKKDTMDNALEALFDDD